MRSGVVVAVAVALSCLSQAGCMIISSDAPPPPHCPNTLGKELRDLKVARDDGAVSDEEYQAAKVKLLATSGKR
jgi:hypothetical protein